MLKWRILWDLMQGQSIAEIALKEEISKNYVRKVKYKFPLFFWREKKRYIK